MDMKDLYLPNVYSMNLKLHATTTVPEALIQKAWAKNTWKAAMNNIFFNRFMGKDANAIIQIVDDLKKTAGDKVTIPLLLKLASKGVTGDNMLEGKEEQLQYRDFSMYIDQYRNAVRIAGKFEEQKSKLKMRADAKAGLSTWLTELIDSMIFEALTDSPTADRVVYGGSGITAENTITAAHKFSTDVIGKAKRIAQMAEPKIRPVKVNGANFYVMVIDPYQARDLKGDEKWRSAQENAANRGKDNPIFTGALGTYDGVVIHENEQVIRTETGDNSTMVGHALFMGAQAGAMAVAQDTSWAEDQFDYGNQVGFAIGRMFGIAKCQFKIDGDELTDFGCINVMTSSIPD